MLKVTSVQVMHTFQKKAFAVDEGSVVEDLTNTIQERVALFQTNTKITRKLIQKHLTMTLY
jgi:hypothetical protein